MATYIVGQPESYATIQAAIDAASVGDTILIDAGTYNENLTINKALTFEGANQGVAGTDGSRGVESILNWASGDAVNVTTTDSVVFDGMEFEGENVTSFSTANTNVTFTNSVFTLTAGGNGGNNFYSSQPDGLTFTDNLVNVTGYTGAFFQPVGVPGDPSHSVVTISGNTFNGIAGTYVAGDDNDVPVIANLSNVTGAVSNNTFNNIDIGVLVADGSGPLDITGNTFENMHRAAPDTGGGLAAGVVFYTPAPFGGDINVSGNTFESSDAGVRTSGVPGSTVAGSPITIDSNSFTSVTDPGYQPAVGGVLHLTNSTVNSVLVPSQFLGGSSNDTIASTSANDLIDGGAGIDTVTYTGAVAITTNLSGGWTVNGGAGAGTDTLTNVEIVDDSAAGKNLLVGNGGYATIQAAINATSAGDTILIAAGTYHENVVVNKAGLTLQGEGTVTIQGTFKSDNSIADGGVAAFLEAGNPYTQTAGRGVDIQAANVTLQDLTINGFTYGVGVTNGSNGATINNVNFTDNLVGIHKGTTDTISNFQLLGGSMTDGLIGIDFDKTTASGQQAVGTADQVTIDGTSFSDLAYKGIYAEALSNAHLTNITMNNVGQFGAPSTSGTAGSAGDGIDLNLKNGSYSNIEIDNFTLTDTGSSNRNGLDAVGQQNGGAIVLEARDQGSYATVPATFTGSISIHDGTIDGSTSTGIQAGEPNQSNAGPATLIQNVTISGEQQNALHGEVANVTRSTMTVDLKDGGDTLTASPTTTGPMIVNGGTGNDSITTGSGNDVITGAGGNDTITGGGGLDTALYSETLARSNFSFDSADNEWIVTTPSEGIDHLSGISIAWDGTSPTDEFLLVGGGSQYATVAQAEAAAIPGDIIVSVPTAVNWASGISGTWQTAGDWTPNTVPGAGDSVFITPSGTYTVTDPQTTTIYSVATAAGATLDVTAGTFTVYAGTDAGANAGTITVEGSAILDVLPSTVTNTGALKARTGGTIDLTGVTVANTGSSVTVTTPLALDGNSFANKAVPSTSASVTLTTSKANDVIILDIVQNGTTVNTVSDAAGLVWYQRAVAGGVGIYEYYAIAANALSADAITVNFAGTASYVDLNAFAVSGANTASPFDSNASDPATAASGTASITTSNANDLIVAGYRFGGTANPTTGAGWTAVNASGGYYLSEYQIVSATQAGLVATAATSDENGGIIDAIVQAPASVTTTGGAIAVDVGAALDLEGTTITGGTLSNGGTVAVAGAATSTLDSVNVTNSEGGSGTSGGSLALDGNSFANKAVASTSASVTLTTAHTNDVIILDIVQNGTTVNTVSDAAGLVWHQRAVVGAAGQTIYEYYAIAANALSADVITVNFAGTASYADLNAFGISGANTSSPFDGNASDPATAASGTASITTSNDNDLIVAGYRFGGTANPTAGAGWTAVNASGGYYLSEYQVVSATQAGLVATAATSDENGGIIDAIVQAPAAPPIAPGALTVDAGSTLNLNNTTVAGGTITNAGTVDVTGSAASALNGIGVTDTSAALTVDATATLDLNNTTITGGSLGNAGTVDSSGTSFLSGVTIANSGLFEATSGTLTVDPNAVTNTGTFEATTGASLALQSVGMNNAGGTVKVDTASTLNLNKSTITGGTLTNSGTGDVIGGATSTLDGVSVTNVDSTVTASTSLALDGNGFSYVPMARGESSATLTTTQANDVIILYMALTGTFVENDGDDVFDTAGLTWSQVAATGSGASLFYEYTAIAPTALSQDTITAIFANTGLPVATNVVFNAFAISGANVSAPFDTNGSVPAVTSTSTAAVTTSNANDFIFAGYQFSSNSTPSAGPGWTAINASGGNFLSEYQIVSAAQSGLVATASSGDENGGIAAAVVQNSLPTATAALTVAAGSTLDLDNTTVTGGALRNFGTVDVTGGSTSILNGVNVGTSVLALDGNVFQKEFGDFGGTPNPISGKVTLTTTQANDVIILDIVQNGSTVSTVSDAAGLAWHQRAMAGSGLQTIYEYYAIAPSALSADAITVNFSNPVDYLDLNAFGISGANTSSPFDNNTSLPATPSASTGSITTSNANDFVFAAYRFAATPFPGAGSGWTAINANDGNYMSEYQIESATQAGLVATASVGDENGGIVDAIVSAATSIGTLTIDAGSALNLNDTAINGGAVNNAGTVDVTGSGTSGLNTVDITNTGGSETIDAGSTLDFSNTTITGGSLSNSGTVDSTGTSALNGVTVNNSGLLEAISGTLTIDPDTVTNAGTLKATAGATLDLQDLNVSNAGGVMKADTASILDINNTAITGGVLTNVGAVDVTGGTTSTLTGVTVANTGSSVTVTTPLALDGNSFANKAVPSTSASVTLTTSKANDVIILDIVQNGTTVNTVSDAAGLVWYQRAVAGGVGIYEYYAIAANALSADAITVNFAGTASYVDLNAFAVSGANTASPFDSNASDPATAASGTASITTSNANDLIVAGYRFGGTANPTTGAGWTAVNASGGYYLSEYQIVSATQAGLVATAATSDENGGIIDAIVQAPASVTTTGGAIAVDVGAALDLEGTTITGGTLSNGGTVAVAGAATSTLDSVNVTNSEGGSGTSGGSLALDGNSFANKAVASTSASVTLTTAHTNDVIILDIVQNGTTVNTVSDAAGLVWHQRAVVGAAGQTIYEYYAIAANALSADVITVNFAGTASYADLNAFGISGANTSSPFDGNASDPATAASGTASIATSNDNDLIVAGYRFGGTANPTAGAGWTAVNASGGYYLSEYQVVSATQAGLVATAATSDENGGIIDAIVQAPAAPPIAPGALTVDAGSTLELSNTIISGGTLSNQVTVDSTGTSALNGVTVTNSGLLEVTGGQLTINTAVANNGNLLANGGTLDITGAVTGSGTATISGTGSVLELGAASAESTTFSPGAVGVLKLDNASAFTGTVAGLATGDSIDLTNFLFSGNPIISGVTGSGNAGTTTDVAVQDGALNVTLHLLNQAANQFAVNMAAYTLTVDNTTPNHGTLFQLAAPV